MGLAGGGGNSAFTYSMLTMVVAITLLMPMFLSLFAPAAYSGASQDEVLDGYERMTGQAADTKISVWPLTGIYTPFTGGFYDSDTNQTITYGYTDDGWLYGTEIKSYTPSQYRSTAQQYTVAKGDDGVFRYSGNSADYSADYGTGHADGDLYTEVSFDVLQKSDIFFVESSRQEDKLGHFKYDYSGYRMAFQPISSYTAVNEDGERVPIIATTTSLSLVWYQHLSQSGITGQMVLLSGSNGGIAYLNAAQIISAFNDNTSTAAFDMVFNGVKMTVYVKIDPMYRSTMTVEDAYNAGFWSIMVTSLSADANAYTGTDYANNPLQLIETVIDLLTFNLDDYNISPWLQTVCSIVFIAPIYLLLIVFCLDITPLWILVGLLAAVQAVGSIWPL